MPNATTMTNLPDADAVLTSTSVRYPALDLSIINWSRARASASAAPTPAPSATDFSDIDPLEENACRASSFEATDILPPSEATQQATSEELASCPSTANPSIVHPTSPCASPSASTFGPSEDPPTRTRAVKRSPLPENARHDTALPPTEWPEADNRYNDRRLAEAVKWGGSAPPENTTVTDEHRKAYGPLLSISCQDVSRVAEDIWDCHVPRSEKSRGSGCGGAKVCQMAVVTGRRIRNNHLVYRVRLLQEQNLCIGWMEIRVPAWGWGQGLNDTGAAAMKSEVDTMRFVYGKGIQVPWVYHYDVSSNNFLGAPYIAVRPLKGYPLCDTWRNLNREGVASPHSMQQDVLSGIAVAQAQLLRLGGFSQLGSIQGSDDGPQELGPVYLWKTNKDGTKAIVAEGPYGTAQDMLARRSMGVYDHQDLVYSEGVRRIMKGAQQTLDGVLLQNNHEGFQLGPPDMDPENMLFTQYGVFCGFSNWSCASTLPPAVGSARYPALITLDSRPEHYRELPEPKDSPATLQACRAFYVSRLQRAAASVGRPLEVFGGRADCVEAMWLANFDRSKRRELCHRIVKLDASDADHGERSCYCEAYASEMDQAVARFGDFELDSDRRITHLHDATWDLVFPGSRRPVA